ncbi:MAG: hypothetical protein IT335_07305 [Thermomicrobiales bacterium]|jgi:hypothetical protein|nr:hypothetical protein [Thermomicrobiales bacterium]
MMDKSEHQIRKIVVERMDRCSVCHRSFMEDDVEVVSRKEDIWMMVVQCKDCHARSFVAALVGEATGTSPMGQFFDLASSGSPFDAHPDAGFTEVEDEPVTVDDVLAMHDFLDSFDGDFRKLLRS